MAYDSASSAAGITWDYRRNLLVGQDKSPPFLPLTQKFQLRANNQKAAEEESNNDAAVKVSSENSILDNIALAKEHLVGIFSSLEPSTKCSEIVASTDVEKPTAPIIFKIDHLVYHTVQQYRLHVALNVVDAHTSNWSALLTSSIHSANNILPRWLIDKFSDVDFSIKHIRVDQVTDQPVANSPDPCHLTKNVVFTLKTPGQRCTKGA